MYSRKLASYAILVTLLTSSCRSERMEGKVLCFLEHGEPVFMGYENST